MKNMRKKSVAVLIGLAVTGLVGASAATLGGVDTQNLGAEVGVVGSCETDGVDVSFATGFAGGITTVTDVTVADIDAACIGQSMTVTLQDGATTLAGPLTTTVTADSHTFAVADISAELLNRVSISIVGPVPTSP